MSRSRRNVKITRGRRLRRRRWWSAAPAVLGALAVVVTLAAPPAWAAGDPSLDADVVTQPVPGWAPEAISPTAISALQRDAAQIGIVSSATIALQAWRSPTGDAALEIMLMHIPTFTPQVSQMPQAFVDGACQVPVHGGSDVLLVPLAVPAGAFSASCTVPAASGPLDENLVVTETRSTFVAVASIGRSPLPGAALVPIASAQIDRLPVPPPPYPLILAVGVVMWLASFVAGLLIRREPRLAGGALLVLLTGVVGLPLYLLGVRVGRAAGRRSHQPAVGGFGLAMAGGMPGPWAPAHDPTPATPGIAPVAAPYDPARFERLQAAQEHAMAAPALPTLGGGPAVAPAGQPGGLPPLGAGVVAPAHGGGLPPLGAGVVAPAHGGGLPPLGAVPIPARRPPPAADPAVPVPAVVPSAAPAGWYPDEREAGAKIYWDGTSWGTRIRWSGNAWIPIGP